MGRLEQAQDAAERQKRRAEHLLGLSGEYDKQAVQDAFRQRAKEAHPDAGGGVGDMQDLIEAKDYLLRCLNGWGNDLENTDGSKPCPMCAGSGTQKSGAVCQQCNGEGVVS